MKSFLMKRALEILNVPSFSFTLDELRKKSEPEAIARLEKVLDRLKKTPTLEMGKVDAFDLGVAIGFLACSMRDENGGEK